MSYYKEVEIFRGSCPKCGVFQVHKDSRCVMSGCLTIHHNNDTKCKCGQVLVKGNINEDDSLLIAKMRIQATDNARTNI